VKYRSLVFSVTFRENDDREMEALQAFERRDVRRLRKEVR